MLRSLWSLLIPLILLLSLRGGVAVGSTLSPAQTPLLGGEFQVNANTIGYQYAPSVAGRGNGTFVVVWQSYPRLGGDVATDIFARRFGADGSPLATEFQVNSYVTGYQSDPDIAMSADGDFFVVWADDSRDGDASGIFARQFDARGEALGTEFQVNSTSAGSQLDPRVSTASNGESVVVWWAAASEAEPDPDGDNSGIFARRYDSFGNAMGPDFKVNTITAGSQAFADVSHDDQGNFVVVWDGSYAGAMDIHGQRFSSDGIATGSEFRVTHDLTDEHPRVSVASDGRFVVVWQNAGELGGVDGSSSDVFAQRFAADGTPVGTPFEVNTYTTDSQDDPVIACEGDGAFVSTWASYAQASSYRDIIAQRYDAAGDAFDGEFKLDSFDDAGQDAPDIAWVGGDRFVVVWTSVGQDGDAHGIFGQRLSAGFSNQTMCGDTDENGAVTAADALNALRGAVGVGLCDDCVCDVNASGGVTAADALLLLRAAVGQPVELACPTCTAQ